VTGIVQARQILICLMVLLTLPITVMSASPGRFQADGTALVFANPNNVTEDGSQTNYPTFCVDPTGSGRESILTAIEVGGTLWRTVSFDAATGRFSLQPGADLPLDAGAQASQARIRLVTPIDSTGKPKVFVEMIRSEPQGLDTVGIFDLQTAKAEGVALTVPGLPIASRDLDGDGVPEILLLAEADPGFAVLTIMDARLTRQSLSTRISVGSSYYPFALGKFSSTAPHQMVTGSGSVYTLTAHSATLVGSIPGTLNGEPIKFLRAADVDGDGLDEIIALYGSTLRVYDFDTQQLKWETTPSINPSAQLVALQLADLAGDGKLEIMLGQVGGPPGTPGYIFVYDSATGLELRTIAHTYVGLYGLNACDFEGSHVRDIVVQTDNPQVGPDDMYVYDSQAGNLKGHSIEEYGPVRGILVADIEGTGSPEVVFQPDGQPGVGDLSIHARDASTFQVRWDTPGPLLPVLGTGRLAALASGNVMGDGHTYLVSGSSQNGQGVVWILNGSTRGLVRTITLDAQDIVESVAVADVDASGSPKILVGVDGPTGPRVEALDGTTGTRLWHANFGSEPAIQLLKIKSADVNHDGHADIAVHVTTDFQGGAEIFVVDGATHAARPLAVTSVSAFEAIDINCDSLPELAVGHTDGTLDVLDMNSASILHHYTGCASGLIAAISADKLSSASPGDVLFSCGSHVGWMSLTNGANEIITSVIANQVGVGDNLLSFGSAPSRDRIIVGSYTGVTHLAPVSALAPFVDPGNARTTNVFAGHWSKPVSDQITFGTFDGASASLELVSQPAHGSVTISGTSGAFTYIGTRPYAGTEYFVVRARTASATSVPTTVPVVLQNSAPSLAQPAASLTVQAGSAGSVNVAPSDSDQDQLTLVVVQAPSKGTVQFNGNTAVYSANTGSSGTDTFSVEAFDQLEYSSPMVVTVSITPASSTPPSNPPPTTPVSGGGGGGTIDLWTLAALLAVIGFRKISLRRRVLY